MYERLAYIERSRDKMRKRYEKPLGVYIRKKEIKMVHKKCKREIEIWGT